MHMDCSAVSADNVQKISVFLLLFFPRCAIYFLNKHQTSNSRKVM